MAGTGHRTGPSGFEPRELGHLRRGERGMPVRGRRPGRGGTARAARRDGDRRDRRDRSGKAGEATAGVKRQYLGVCGEGGQRDQHRPSGLCARQGRHVLIGARQWIPAEHLADPVSPCSPHRHPGTARPRSGRPAAARRARHDPADHPGDQATARRPHHPAPAPVACHSLGRLDPPPQARSRWFHKRARLARDVEIALVSWRNAAALLARQVTVWRPPRRPLPAEAPATTIMCRKAPEMTLHDT